MNICTYNFASLKYRALREVRKKHPDLFDAMHIRCRNYILGLLTQKNCYIPIIALECLFLWLAPKIDLPLFNFMKLSMVNATSIIDARATNMAAIVSISLVVVGFLITNLAVKSPTTFKILFRESLLYFTLYLTLTTISAFILVSLNRETIDPFNFIRFVIALSYLCLLILFLIGNLFRKIVFFSDEKEILRLLQRELIEEARLVLRRNLIRQESARLYELIFEEFAEPEFEINLDLLSGATFTFMDAEEIEPIKLRQISDINISGLKGLAWLKKLFAEDVHFKKMHLDMQWDMSKEPFWSNAKPNGSRWRWWLRRCLISKKIKDTDTDSYMYRKDFDEKLKLQAEEGKYRNLEITLEAYYELLDLQLSHPVLNPLSTEDITYGAERLLAVAFEKSFLKNDSETFAVLNKYLINVLVLSIKKRSLAHFERYIIMLPGYYQQVYPLAKNNLQFQSLGRVSRETAARIIKELINYYLSYPQKELKEFNYADLEKTNEFLYRGINSFGRLFYYITRNADIAYFDFALNEFHQLDTFSRNNFADLSFRVRNFEDESAEFRQQKKLYEVVSKRQLYQRHLTIAVKYWSYYLYGLGQLELTAARYFTEKLPIRADYEELIKDLLELRSNTWTGYLELSSWDYKERLDSKPYQPPSPSDWLQLGYFIDAIKAGGHVYFNLSRFSKKQIQELSLLHHSLADDATVIAANYSFWEPILGTENIEDFHQRTYRIIAEFRKFEIHNAVQRQLDVAEAPIDPAKVAIFHESVGESWSKHSIIRNLFIEKGTRIQDAAGVVKYGGEAYHENLKSVFIAGDNYPTPSGLSDLGGQLARSLENSFYEQVISAKEPEVNGSIADSISKGLKLLRERKKIPNVIIIPAEYGWHSHDLYENADFLKKDNIPVLEADKLWPYIIGYFDNIPVYITHSDILQGRFVISDFAAAFQMNYQQVIDGFESELTVKVAVVSDERAKERYDQYPKHYQSRAGLAEALSEADALIYIKNGVYLDISTHTLYTISDPDSFLHGVISAHT